MASAAEGEEKMPEAFSIGTRTAYDKGYAYLYKKQNIDNETVFVCTKGSDYAEGNEVLVLRCESGVWIAYDSSVTGNELICRQQVFRSHDGDITKAGMHEWQMNTNANKGGRSMTPSGVAICGVKRRWQRQRVQVEWLRTKKFSRKARPRHCVPNLLCQ